MPVSSDGIAGGRVTVRQGNGPVWLDLATSATAWARCHLVSHWLPDLTRTERSDMAIRIDHGFMSPEINGAATAAIRERPMAGGRSATGPGSSRQPCHHNADGYRAAGDRALGRRTDRGRALRGAAEAERLIRITTVLGVVGVTGVTAIISCQRPCELVSCHGQSAMTGPLLPCTKDGLICAMAVLNASGGSNAYRDWPGGAGWSRGIGIAALVGADMAHGIAGRRPRRERAVMTRLHRTRTAGRPRAASAGVTLRGAGSSRHRNCSATYGYQAGRPPESGDP
jgi:hypothetical protein